MLKTSIKASNKDVSGHRVWMVPYDAYALI